VQVCHAKQVPSPTERVALGEDGLLAALDQKRQIVGDDVVHHHRDQRVRHLTGQYAPLIAIDSAGRPGASLNATATMPTKTMNPGCAAPTMTPG
jgi:hypothetical protein